MKATSILLLTLSILCNNCSIEPIVIATDEPEQLLDTIYEVEDFITPDVTASCVPIVPVTFDSTIVWLGLEDLYAGNQEFGSAKAWLNQYDWEASAVAYYFNDGIGIVFRTFRGEHHLDHNIEEFIFVIDKNNSPCIRLNAGRHLEVDENNGRCTYNIGDGDVGIMYYDVVLGSKNLLEITTLDTIQNYISGNFTVTLAPPGIPQLENIPDTVRFVNGSFFCQILDF